jgi:dual oxidase
LRSFSLKNTKSIQVELSQESYTKKRPLVLLRMCNVNDLVLELESDGARRKIVKKLEDFLILHKKEMTITEQNRELMLAKARKRE